MPDCVRPTIKSYIGVTAAVILCNAGSIEGSVGTARRVFDRRGEQLPAGRA